MATGEYAEFYCDTLEDLKATIEAQGVAVVRGAVAEHQLGGLRNGMWSTLSTLTKGRVQRDDTSSYRNFLDLLPMHSMLLQHYGLGHAQYVWDVRSCLGVREPFARIWGVQPSELITSFDGVSIHLPFEYTGRGYFRNTWFHTDQASTERKLCSVQGVVNLYDVREGDATLCVLTESNKWHSSYFDHFGITEKENWYKLPKDDAEHTNFFTERGCQVRRVLAKAGDLILWDSRVFHFGSEPLKTRAEPNYRAVVYVCMVPRAWAAPKALEKRLKIFEDGRMTTHTPHKPRLFPKTPRTYGKALPDVAVLPRPVLTEEGRQLV